MADITKREENQSNFGQQAGNLVPSHQNTAAYLDHTQQDLLLAALNSQLPHAQSATGQDYKTHNMTSADTFTPDLLDLDDSFDFEDADLGGSMIGALPGSETFAEQHEKRKASDDEDVEGGDLKRQEMGGEKGATKKPGRKPLTSEPTTKRKAQNRAAQRAFRERKEAHLKDLETKVTELTKSSEADKHENGLLKAQVARLQTELREYRKRLSLNSNSVKRSPTLSGTQPANNSMGFNFDFPSFGSLPTAQILGGQPNSITPPLSNHSPGSATYNSQPSRHNSEARSMSPATQNKSSSTRQSSRMSSIDPMSVGPLLPYSTSDNMHGFASTLPQMGKTANDPFGDLFSPSILKSVNAGKDNGYFERSNNTTAYNTSNGGDSTAGIPDNRVFRFNSTSVASDSASPSTSSLSQGHTAASSCSTSPEPLNDSPATKLKSLEGIDENVGAQNGFVPSALQSNDLNFASLDSFNVPHVETFDPVLFGDYRDTNESIVGGGDFTGGLYDDSYNTAGLDWGSPSNLFGILSPTAPQVSNAATPSRNLISECDKVRDGGDDEYGLPKTAEPDKGNLISCTKIWSQLQSNPEFQDGTFDLEGLCSELRTKARCSESGLMVDSDHVDAALKKLSQKGPSPPANGRSLMFEQESWDNVLKKLQAGKQ